MKKIFSFIVMVVFMFSLSTVYATEKMPTFTKKDAVIFYEVPDQILMCQNKQEDMIKGAIEFEKNTKKILSETLQCDFFTTYVYCSCRGW